ncbi:hypothetical protein GX411_05965 [Candidatus Fermentibacteria bacterium]|nr:hypothetical protein [Candidatus Fermentibacteria bacterium]
MRAQLISTLALAGVCAASAAGFSQYAALRFESDSLGLDPGRRHAEWSGLLEGSRWEIGLRERILLSDSGGTVPRWLLGRSDLEAEARAWLGPVIVNPSVRWSREIDEGPMMILPVQAGEAFYRGFVRPALTAEASLPAGFSVSATGRMLDRSLEMPEGGSPGWSAAQYGGTFEWRAPRGFELYAGGYSSSTDAGDLGWNSDWSRLDAGVRSGPVSFPARTQVLADLQFTGWDGNDYLGMDLGDRVTCSARAVRWLTPRISLNITGRSCFDRRDGEWTHSLGAGIARVNLFFGLPALNPSSLTLAGMYTSSAFTTSRFEASSRVKLYRGLYALFSGDFRSGPTVFPGAPATRRRVILGTGLEYRLGTTAVIWTRVENERTELAQIEDWARLEAGLEITP